MVVNSVTNKLIAIPKSLKAMLIGAAGSTIDVIANPVARYRTMKEAVVSTAKTVGNPFARLYNSRNSDVEYEKHMLQPISLPKA